MLRLLVLLSVVWMVVNCRIIEDHDEPEEQALTIEPDHVTSRALENQLKAEWRLQERKKKNKNSNKNKKSVMSETNDSANLESIKNILMNIAEFIEQGCSISQGFVKFSNQCFKLLKDTELKYDDAKARCQQLGLELAKPNSPVGLRSFLVEKYGGSVGHVWLGARGNGTDVKWERDQTIISNEDQAWWKGPNIKDTPDYCLTLLSDIVSMEMTPTTPLDMATCAAEKEKRYQLCELV